MTRRLQQDVTPLRLVNIISSMPSSFVAEWVREFELLLLLGCRGCDTKTSGDDDSATLAG